MESPGLGIIILVGSALLVVALAVPVTAIAIHQRRRRAYERAAGVRRKEKIRL